MPSPFLEAFLKDETLVSAAEVWPSPDHGSGVVVDKAAVDIVLDSEWQGLVSLYGGHLTPTECVVIGGDNDSDDSIVAASDDDCNDASSCRAEVRPASFVVHPVDPSPLPPPRPDDRVEPGNMHGLYQREANALRS